MGGAKDFRSEFAEPLWMSFGLVAALRCIKPAAAIVPVMDYVGETEEEALARFGMTDEDLAKTDVEFVHLA